jgi:hypothetical protein
VVGSTNLSVADATELLDRSVGELPEGAPEWKWKYLATNRHRSEAFFDQLDSASAASAAVHHRFFGWTKAVDTLIYEHQLLLGSGRPEYTQMEMVGLAHMSWEAVRHAVDPFLDAYITAVRTPTSRHSYALGRAARELKSTCTDRDTSRNVLRPLVAGAREFDRLLRAIAAPHADGPFRNAADHIDPHLAALGALPIAWRERLGTSAPIEAHHDEILPDDIVDRWSSVMATAARMHLTRGRSVDDPRLQVADLVAGATECALRPTESDTRRRTVQEIARAHVGAWLPRDATIVAFRDPRSQLRPEGSLSPRSDYDR